MQSANEHWPIDKIFLREILCLLSPFIVRQLSAQVLRKRWHITRSRSKSSFTRCSCALLPECEAILIASRNAMRGLWENPFSHWSNGDFPGSAYRKRNMIFRLFIYFGFRCVWCIACVLWQHSMRSRLWNSKRNQYRKRGGCCCFLLRNSNVKIEQKKEIAFFSVLSRMKMHIIWS